MASPLRKPTSEDEPYSFRVIDGGGQTTPDRAKLRTAESPEADNSNFQVVEGGGDYDPSRKSNKSDFRVVDGNDDYSASGLNDVENEPGSWKNNVTRVDASGKKDKGKAKFFKPGTKFMAIFGGGLGISGLLMLAMMPLKLEMFIQNITTSASQIPGYAIESRTEYLMTRALSTHILKSTYGDSIDSNLVFCGGGGVACALTSTWTASYFENLMDFNFSTRSDGLMNVTMTAKGRTALGGRARSWDITVVDNDVGRLTQTLNSNAEAKAFIKNRVNTDLKTKNRVTRFLARKILMKKYGITHWRGFEKLTNNITELKTNIKTKIIKNTSGKISKKMTLYLSCMSDPSTCASLKEGYLTDATALQRKLDELAPDDPTRSKIQRQIDALNKLGSSTFDGLGKNPVFRALTGAMAAYDIAGILDIVFSAVEAVDQGAFEQVSADLVATAYTGFTFGDEIGIAVNNDKMKAGDLDIETLGVLSDMFNGAESSALMQVENGLISEEEAINGTFTATCNVNDEDTKITLEEGELVCPEQKIVRDYTSWFSENGIWSSFATLAAAWNNSFGVIVGVLDGIVGTIIEYTPIVSQIVAQIGQWAASLFEWIIGVIFEAPPIGIETSGANNYVAVSGAIRSSQNDLMAEGVGDDNLAYGGGGQLLTDEQVAVITEEQKAEQQEEFNSQSTLAKIFNPLLYGSFAQKFIAQMPTSYSGLFGLFSSSITSALNASPNSSAATSASTINPFGLPIYGYAADDAALTADPSTYTEAQCEEFAKKREESYIRDPSVFAALPVYTVTDPCALEKMVVGAALGNVGVTDNEVE